MLESFFTQRAWKIVMQDPMVPVVRICSVMMVKGHDKMFIPATEKVFGVDGELKHGKLGCVVRF